ncbi:aminotransferase class I/II-fold pyridoxal phosphate-dependent enzyme [Flagellimonas algicola]|uniref:Aminotransferase class I/II-fold pyridoxal phosphate-dependent enzyme n=1 Tax=Flagellimonas algicola TaxID=2583815 RepID=A0ABY2WMF9_9FLAO|nr:aminotransferase class I/II-fold pyridoxal phosphate-dependent enzyme [Allomuricauda algicola]
MNINSKLPNLGTTIFTVIGQLAKEHNAINLSQGFPNFSPDFKLLQLVNKAHLDDFNQYAPMQGVLSLRETISEKTESLYGTFYHPESEVTITAGATEAIFTSIAAFIKPEDEVIVLRPAYDCYEPAIELFGGIVVPIPLIGSSFKVDWDALKKAISPKTRMMIINTPHNPTGTLWSESDMLQLQEVLKDTDIILLSDEVYEHITFDGEQHHSVSKFSDLASRSIICSSFGKTFHVTGWKIGYCVAPKALMQEFHKVHQYNVFSVNHALQIALNEYLQSPEHYLELGNFYQKKRDHFLNAIQGSRFEAVPSAGTYFQLLHYGKITDEKDTDFAERLIKEYQLASIPISVFCGSEYNEKFLRFCFGKTEDILDQAVEILHRI